MRLKLASRKSDLARWQATVVARRLEKEIQAEIEFQFKSSLGDQNLDIPLANMGARGVFTEDFYEDLKSGACDLVVHSWKDLPVEERRDTHIAMTLERADVRDILLIPEAVWTRALAAKKLDVFTSSPRRVYNLGQALPTLLPSQLEVEFHNVRGNVPTRLSKMHQEGKALVLAKAGLDRLLEAEKQGFGETSVRALIQDCRFQILPVSLNPPAAAQGALAIEVARANQILSKICQEMNHLDSYQAVQEEREILKRYGGGCHQKIGVAVLKRRFGTVYSLKGITDQGEVLNRWSIEDGKPWARARSPQQVFPLEPRLNLWFEREIHDVTADLSGPQALFIARADAWPEGQMPDKGQILWTAGVQTWQKLARQGLFINGSQDGLGESEEELRLEQITGPLEWTKLSHDQAPASLGRCVATYRLRPLSQTPDLRQKTHFFWMSGTAFDRAYKLFPDEVRNGYNACGPGHTLDHLLSVKDLKNSVKVFAGLNQFLAMTLD